MNQHRPSRRSSVAGVSLLLALLLALTGAAVVTAASAGSVARRSARHPTHRRRPPHYLGVRVVVGSPIGPRSPVVVSVYERQRIIYTVRVRRGDSYLPCDTQEETQIRGRPGHVATFRIRPSVGLRWCVGRWSVRVLHVTFGADPCQGDEICRDGPPEYDRLLGGAHFRVLGSTRRR